MKFFAHPTAIVDSRKIGARTRIWAFSHVQEEASIGNSCNIGENCFIENEAVVGNNVTIKNGVCLWMGITVHNGVFIGPNATFTNDRHPRSPRLRIVAKRYANGKWLNRSVLEEGCTIGANATIIGPVRLGRYCFVAAGTVVTRDVEPFELVAGNPCRQIGWVDKQGTRVAHRPLPAKRKRK